MQETTTTEINRIFMRNQASTHLVFYYVFNVQATTTRAAHFPTLHSFNTRN